MGNHPKATVTCRDCGTQWEMRTEHLPNWGGRCRHCALIERHSRRYAGDPPGHKTCTQCGAVKPVAAFYELQGRPAAQCKACHTTATAEYKQTERGRQVKAASDARCADRVKAGKARYYARHRDEVIGRTRAAYEADPAAWVAKTREWRERNPEAAALQAEQRRARKLQNGGRLRLAEWRAIKQQQDYRCLMCGQQEPAIRLSMDHIVPLSRGGRHAADNIQGLCRPCNARKGTKTLDLRVKVPDSESDAA